MCLKMPSYRFTAALLAAGVALLILLVGMTAFAAGGGEDSASYVPGQLLVNFKASSSAADVSAAALSANMRVVRKLPVGNWYLLETLTEGADLENMQVALSNSACVKSVSRNFLMRLTATPNDSLWNMLWGMVMIKAPEAWDIQKGSSAVRVAVVDTGVRLDHPDLQGRLLPGYDVAEDDSDPNIPDEYQEFWSHGTHVAGTIAAQGNNSIGVVGVCWDGVKIIPIKISADDSTDGTFPMSNGILGLDKALQLGANVVNMSWGAGVPLQALEDKVNELAAAGMILVGAAGNESGPVIYPAAYDNVICVSAVGPTGTLASYSNYGAQVDIAAPGGELTSNNVLDPAGIVSCAYMPTVLDPANGYVSWQGTSMAAPHVSGAAALLLSNGVAPSAVRAALQGSATHAGTGTPNQQYGYGILNLLGALTYQPVHLEILRPHAGDFVTTRRPFFHITVAGASANSVQVKLDGATIIEAGQPVDGGVENFELNANTGDLVFTKLFDGAGTHNLQVTASAASSSTQSATKSSTFTIRAVSLAAGKYMFAVPYRSQVEDPSSVLGTSLYKIARAVTLRSAGNVPMLSYAYYNYPGLVNDSEASLVPPGANAGPADTEEDGLPRGLGYWLDLRSAVQILGTSYTDDRSSYQMELPSGWNQIGNPFPFPVSWGNVLVTYLGETVPVAQAAERGWINPSLYRYENGVYRSDAAPNGVMEPWQGYWVKVKVPLRAITMKAATDPPYVDDPRFLLTLTVPPLQAVTSAQATGSFGVGGGTAGRSTNTMSLCGRRAPRRPVAGASVWSLPFSVVQNGQTSQGPVVGLSASAKDGYDSLDIETPPPAASTAWAAVYHSDWGSDSGYYSTDMRPVAGAAQSWTVNVATYSAGNVTLKWGNLGSATRVYRVQIEDVTSSQTLNVSSGEYTFPAPAGSASHQFRVTAIRRFR